MKNITIIMLLLFIGGMGVSAFAVESDILSAGRKFQELKISDKASYELKIAFDKEAPENAGNVAGWIEHSWNGRQFIRALALFPMLDRITGSYSIILIDKKTGKETRIVSSFSEVKRAPDCRYIYLPGDVNMHNAEWPPVVRGSDVTYLIGYLKGNPNLKPCYLNGFWASADVNGDCRVIGSDVTRLIGYLKGTDSIKPCPLYPPSFPQAKEATPTGWPFCE